jgi:hypothetical protein
MEPQSFKEHISSISVLDLSYVTGLGKENPLSFFFPGTF